MNTVTPNSNARRINSGSGALQQNAALIAELSALLSVVEPASVANMILQRAFLYRATDIHLEPTSGGMLVRFRVDGVLQDILPVPEDKAAILTSRIKIMAGMNISERRLPQDGAIAAEKNEGLPRDIRVGSIPTVNGERLVLRLMPDPNELSDLTSLGFLDDQLEKVQQLLNVPYGLLLVVGPVGSGKSTSVYSVLQKLRSPEKSILTIEDPVERRVNRTSQIQIDPKVGLTFVSALRGALRQDPNIISIGEIRDPETAQIACRAATTGVLVLSTLHANNTSSAIDVLRGFGISSMGIADCLRGVISQRLVRKICSEAYEEYAPSELERDLLKLPPESSATISRGIPTPKNFNTGYAGRTAVFEVMQVNAAVRDAINRSEPAYRIQQVAVDGGMNLLEDATRRKVLSHETTTEELRRVMVDTHLQKTVIAERDSVASSATSNFDNGIESASPAEPAEQSQPA